MASGFPERISCIAFGIGSTFRVYNQVLCKALLNCCSDTEMPVLCPHDPNPTLYVKLQAGNNLSKCFVLIKVPLIYQAQHSVDSGPCIPN